MLTSPMRFAVPLVVAVALMGVAGPPAAAGTGQPAERPAVTAAAAPALVGVRGWARVDYPIKEEEIRIHVDARGLVGPRSENGAAAHSWGTFRIQHLIPRSDGRPPIFNWGDFAVDCVRVDGSEAAVTGRIVTAGPYWQEFLERRPPARMGLSFHIPADGTAPTRIGITAPTAAGTPEVGKCAVASPDADVIEGGYRTIDTRG
ncbi:hypothetical protein ABZ714_19695 [Streptomyces sp. NPDC006798]|uniref:hypothetical protein n=1 Tax=Streptomyces sp. NPDC006798 TaxID=3155462 RepID=UPI003408459E